MNPEDWLKHFDLLQYYIYSTQIWSEVFFFQFWNDCIKQGLILLMRLYDREVFNHKLTIAKICWLLDSGEVHFLGGCWMPDPGSDWRFLHTLVPVGSQGQGSRCGIPTGRGVRQVYGDARDQEGYTVHGNRTETRYSMERERGGGRER